MPGKSQDVSNGVNELEAKMKFRGRPKKYRIVKHDPKISQFSPRGRPGRPEQMDIGIDEFEAIRLADYMGLSQKEAAKSMHISQQTFSRVLRRARKIIANGLVIGATIKIQGGQYVISSRENLEGGEISGKRA